MLGHWREGTIVVGSSTRTEPCETGGLLAVHVTPTKQPQGENAKETPPPVEDAA